MKTMELTPDSLAMLKRIIRASGSWTDTPPTYEVVNNVADKGNLTDLKKRGLVSTWTDEGFTWINISQEAWNIAFLQGWVSSANPEELVELDALSN